MNREDFFFWRNWPVKRRKRYFQLLALVWVLVWVMAFASVAALRESAERAELEAKARHLRVAPLVAEAKALKEQGGELSNLSPMAVVQQIGRDMGLGDRVASVRPAQLPGGRQGVQVLYQALDMVEFVDVLTAISGEARLQIVAMTMNHRLDQPDRADLQLTVGR